jgi:hypothetical protein
LVLLALLELLSKQGLLSMFSRHLLLAHWVQIRSVLSSPKLPWKRLDLMPSVSSFLFVIHALG